MTNVSIGNTIKNHVFTLPTQSAVIKENSDNNTACCVRWYKSKENIIRDISGNWLY